MLREDLMDSVKKIGKVPLHFEYTEELSSWKSGDEEGLSCAVELCSKKKESTERPPSKVCRVLPGTQGQRKSSHLEDGPLSLSDFVCVPRNHFLEKINRIFSWDQNPSLKSWS